MIETNRMDIPAESDTAEYYTCAVCGHRAARGEVEAQLIDGEQGTYMLLCADRIACDGRVLDQTLPVDYPWPEPEPAVQDEREFPF